MTEVNLGDGLTDAICPEHGRLLRLMIGAWVLCNQCKKWIRAGASEKLRQRRDHNRNRKRKQRVKAPCGNQ